MTNAILEAESVRVQYGELVAVESATIRVPEGDAVALIGPNGAGKTSLLKALSGVLPMAGGRMWYRQQEVTGRPSHELSRMGIALIPEGRLPFSSMTVLENLMLPVYSQRMDKRQAEERLDFVYSLFPRLKERTRQRAGSLSGGEQQMLVVARALMMNPKILLIDEPSLGLAPIIVQQIYEVLPQLKNLGVSILLVEQSSTLALSVCSSVYVMREGKIVFSGNSSDVTQEELTHYYLK